MSEEVPQHDPVPAPESKADLNQLGRRLGSVQRNKAKTELRKTERVAKVSKPFDDAIARLTKEEDAVFEAIVNYAIAHKDELVDEGTQTIKLASIDIQWKLDGNGTLVFISSEADIVAKLERIKDGKECVKVVKTVKKDPVKKNPIIIKKLGRMVDVVYGESVIVTTKPNPALTRRGAKKISRTREIS